jgi:hypothetical protein
MNGAGGTMVETAKSPGVVAVDVDVVMREGLRAG